MWTLNNSEPGSAAPWGWAAPLPKAGTAQPKPFLSRPAASEIQHPCWLWVPAKATSLPWMLGLVAHSQSSSARAFSRDAASPALARTRVQVQHAECGCLCSLGHVFFFPPF